MSEENIIDPNLAAELDIKIELYSLREAQKNNAKEIAELRKDIKGLVEAWNTAVGINKFVKWLASVVTAAGIVYYFLIHGKFPS